MQKITVELGQKVYFDPFADMQHIGDKTQLHAVEEGAVDFVNRKARWFSVVYGKLRTSFFFWRHRKVGVP